MNPSSPSPETLRPQPTLTARLKVPALLDKARSGESAFFLQFGGQATDYFEELRNLYTRHPLTRSLIESAATVLAEESSHPDAVKSGLVSAGLDLVQWIQNTSQTPDAKYLALSPVSQPLIFITQTAHFVQSTGYGIPQKELLQFTKGLTGHSQGIMAAILIAMDLDGEAFLSRFLEMVRYFFWQGVRMQNAYPETHLVAELRNECLEKNWGSPSPMAALAGMTPEELEPLLLNLNKSLPISQSVSISLNNGFKKLVLSGSPEGLIALRRKLARLETEERKKIHSRFQLNWEFLSVSGPYHSEHMRSARDAFRGDLKRLKFNLVAKELKLPVYATDDGRNLQNSGHLLEDLLTMQFLKPVDWNLCTREALYHNGVTHILDFGPGEMASTLTFLNREGDGVIVLPCAVSRGQDELLTTDAAKLRNRPTPWKSFQPEPVRLPNGNELLTNRYVEFTGKPPVFGGGMTPTSVESDIVIAAANGGYLVEWAGGGQVTESMLIQRFDEIVAKLNPGEGVIFNALYLDAYLWNLHFPLLIKLKAKGYPIDGLTISAGVPTREKAGEILKALHDAGIWCNSFKPGSDEQIRAVLEIADDHPQHKIIIQIEGGKAGGHHSWEDLYGLLERHYAAIRRRQNLILCAGGGIGFAEEATSLLEGTWSKSGKIMPVDAVFIGTRLMACREAKTSPQVKKLLCGIEGSKEWVTRGEFRNGVTSGQSQLGADVHYADNAMSRVARFIDDISTRDESEIIAQKNKIVTELAKTAKPYFGDLETMTYGEVIERLINLMAPGKMPVHFISDGEWFDVSYRQRAFDFILRTLARLDTDRSITLNGSADLDRPDDFLKTLRKKLPAIDSNRLHPEDIDYFLLLCRRPGKPVNFVPVIDKSIKRWFKSDSLWQAHDPRYSAEQVLTIPGITAIKGIRKINEPVCAVFEEFVATAKRRVFTTANSAIRTVSFPGEPCPATEVPHHAGAIPALFSSPCLLEGTRKRRNYFPELLQVPEGGSLDFTTTNNRINAAVLSDSHGKNLVTIKCADSGNKISVTLNHHSANDEIYPLTLNYVYEPTSGQFPIRLDHSHARSALIDVYRKLWLKDTPPTKSNSLFDVYSGTEKVTEEMARDFARVTLDRSSRLRDGEASPSLAIVLVWKPLSQCLFQNGLELDLLHLLHLSNEFKLTDPTAKILVGETVETSARLTGIKNEKQGKTLTIEGTVSRNGNPLLTMTSRFLVRIPSDHENIAETVHFASSGTLTYSEIISARLAEKKWYKEKVKPASGEVLSFKITGFDQRLRNGTALYQTRGEIHKNNKTIGTIDFSDSGSTLKMNPTRYFFDRFANPESGEIPQENGLSHSRTFTAPRNNGAYSVVSRDLNPIHTDPRFAALAGLPQDQNGCPIPIVHGMWTSAATLSMLCSDFQEAVRAWRSEFVGMVIPGETLTLNAEHTGNRNGLRIFNVTTLNSKGQSVLSGRLEIAQKKTAYLFTGQGSQAQGMGMTAYDTSPSARAVWDEADAFCRNELGFSILQVVRDNPREMYVGGFPVQHPQGVLNLTQFSQVALTVLAMSQIAELKDAGLYVSNAYFAGHSLGEYAALSCSGIIPLPKVIKVVYQRGLTMQNFVPRDNNGKSPYGMIVVRPHIVGMKERELEDLIRRTAKTHPSGEIYLVNFNIEGSQYSVTGRSELLENLMSEMRRLEKNAGTSKSSCILIEGVDVPFHSPILSPGVEAFRKTLEETIPHAFDPGILINQYIPNLNAETFRLDRDYVESVYSLTDSPVLKQLLKNWKSSASNSTVLARTLLIELLAYQFASPVQWIKTQKLILNSVTDPVLRIIEIGPSAVLTNMLKATISKSSVNILPRAMHFDSDRDAVFYREPLAESPSAAINTSPRVEVKLETTPAKPASSGIRTGGPAPQDVPFSVERGLRTLLALKLNIRPDEIKETESLESLSGGNSARRNEILSEIGAEFSVAAIDDAHQMPFSRLVETLEKKSSYRMPGKFLLKAIERVLKEKLPLGKRDILDHLSGERMLPEGLATSVLADLPLAVRPGNSTRSGALSTNAVTERITDKNAALAWIDAVTDHLGSRLGVSIPHRSTSGDTQGSMISEEALKKFEDRFFGPKSPFAQWAKDMLKLTANPESPSENIRDYQEIESRLKTYETAFGPAIEKTVTPAFDPKKKVSLTSSWNWSRLDLAESALRTIQEEKHFSDKELNRLASRMHPESRISAKYFSHLASEHKLSRLAKQLENLASTGDKTHHDRNFIPELTSSSPQINIDQDGRIEYREISRPDSHNTVSIIKKLREKKHLRAEKVILDAIENSSRNGVNFSNKVFLITGASPGSIAWETLKMIIESGGTAIATTSSYSETRIKCFRDLYRQHSVSTSKLHVFPFNQGSATDISALIKWCFDNRLIPDFLLPFGAIGEAATLTMMGPDASTATLRVLLQGVEWLIAEIAKNLRAINARNRHCQVLLPLSPNHGNFGGDGAYADAKLGLETLLNRWHAEHDDWGKFISLIGVRIGWVRGTGLMLSNNILAATMEESAGVRTFSPEEAGFILTSLCQENIVRLTSEKPYEVSFTGGFENVSDLAQLAAKSRLELEAKSRMIKSLRIEESEEKKALNGENPPVPAHTRKAPSGSTFPKIAAPEVLKSFKSPQPIKPRETIVVVGFGEVSPFGSSRPRFEMECGKCLSLNGAIELAWIMGLIRYEDGTGKIPYVGWVDAVTGNPVADDHIWETYGESIINGTGVRFTEPETQKFDPRSTVVFGDVVLEQPFSFLVENEIQALAHARHYGDSAVLTNEGNQWRVSIAAGSTVKVPRRVELSRFVAGQIPRGWDPLRYGIPAELATQIDRTTLYNLAASAQAFVSAGLEAEELHENISPTMIGNSQGGGMGGMTALNRVYHDHREDRERQGDALQETLINVGPAWTNQSLVGGYGPTVNPVSACATAIVSLGVGCDLIQQGKAEFVVAGGYDDYSEEGIIGFQDMAATCDTQDMLSKGISPQSMSRPNDARRGGFVEAQGGGTLLLTTLSRALDMGLPVYAVIAFGNNYSDGIHTSIPAPGLGILGMVKGGKNSPLNMALKKFGATADDITVVSKHDTSTAANDPNENRLHHLAQTKLGRTDGNPLYVHSQKAMLGHAKGGAGAWQAIAAIQMLETGIIPGNPNLEDVDPAMREHSTLLFSDHSLHLGSANVRGVIMTSLGFGHVGAVSVFLHPNFVLAGLSKTELQNYLKKRDDREKLHMKRHWESLMGKLPLYQRRKIRPDQTDEIKLLTE